MTTHNEPFKKPFTGRLLFIPPLIVLLLQYAQLEFSAEQEFSSLFAKSPAVLFGNLILILSVNLLLYLAVHHLAGTLYITNVFFSVLSLLNYYVIMFHGSPAYLTELKSAKTAVNVMGEYVIRPDIYTVILSGFTFAEVFLTIVFKLLQKRYDRETRRELPVKAVFASTLAACAMSLFMVFSEAPISIHAITWAWKQGVQKYGYPASLAKNALALFHPVKIPEGYSPEAVKRLAADMAGAPDSLPVSAAVSEDLASSTYPDLIVILNESFCDLNDYLDLNADVDFMHNFYNIGNSYVGHAVSPQAGGGTNNSEFELLTGNSLYLVNISAPFTYMDFSVSDNSVPKYLKKLGYHTIGMHCGEPVNYNREKAYPALGFDRSILGPGYYELNYNGNRPWLDFDNYKDLLKYYDEAGDGPRFMYLLSFMNHGGYEQNDPSFAEVHAQIEPAKLRDQVNEYLSSISLASRDFEKLTGLLKERERPVIVLMVGDHAPTFIQELPRNEKLSPEEQEIAMRTVPYILWSNYEVEFPKQGGFASMTDLIPLMLKTAGLPLNSYYRTILSLQAQLPVRTSFGTYVTGEGNTGVFNDKSPWYRELQNYYYMEYNALAGGNDYAGELFSPETAPDL